MFRPGKEHFFSETLGGMQEVWLTGGGGEAVNITADIGVPRLAAAQVPVTTGLERFIDQPVEVLDRTFRLTALSWGNPHCVAFVEDTASLPVEKYGPAIERNTALFPRRTNVTSAQVVRPDYLKNRGWERRTGESIGCGTGCCTAVVAGALLGLCARKAEVEQIGGVLQVEWRTQDDHVRMTGPSHIVYEGEYRDETD